VPKEVLKHVPKTVKKKVCVSTKAHDDHYSVPEIHYDDDHDHHGGYSHGGGYVPKLQSTIGLFVSYLVLFFSQLWQGTWRWRRWIRRK
jgi:hypothetical protein